MSAKVTTGALLVVGGGSAFVAGAVFVTLPAEIWSTPAPSLERLRLIGEARGTWVAANALFLASASLSVAGFVAAAPWLARRTSPAIAVPAVVAVVSGLAAWGAELVGRLIVAAWAAARPLERLPRFEAVDRYSDLGIILLLGLVGAAAIALGAGMRRGGTFRPALLGLGTLSLLALVGRIPALAFPVPLAIGVARLRERSEPSRGGTGR